MDIKTEYMNMLHFRHATRNFDTNRKITHKDRDYILEAGRLSPSSFGIEPWEFLVVESKSIQRELQKICFNQKQITQASLVIVVLARKDLKLEDAYVEKLLRRDGNEYYERNIKNMYGTFISNLDEKQIFNYADKQCYLASMNLMNAGAILGISSCPIGGFEYEKIAKLFKLDLSKYGISLVIPFGYNLDTTPKKSRRLLDDIVNFI